MKEFMLLIRNQSDAKASLTAEEHLAFIKKCEVYIGILKSQGKLIAAQPLIREGFIVSKTSNDWLEQPVKVNGEIQVGYYHIVADDIAEAIHIAKDNPEFEYVPSATIEVRPIKTKERETAFVYPTK
ncbi:YciI family protein [Ferruginibacter sp. SUN106]|uniref:YciI family protein n=1 Tax=Ferruginibacter sp. SUN106 TaxID=2978348 RepID=UPI003D36F6AE